MQTTGEPSAKLKVLIITYYWPPAGGPGVQRWLKFVKYLPGYGVEPVVYIPQNPSYPLQDERLIEEIPDGVTIIKQKITEPYAWASVLSKGSAKKISSGIIPDKKKQSIVQRLMLWVRGNVFIPDARVLWVKPSIRYLTDYLKNNPVDVVITTGPPHSLHLIGLGLKKRNNIKWIADFRDPWTSIGYHKELKLSNRAAKKHKFLEKHVLTSADHIVVTSPTTKKEFEGLTNVQVSVITNGYDTEKISHQPLDEKFSIAHIGSLLSERNPQVLWQVLAELTKQQPDFGKFLEIKLIGAVSKEVLHAMHEHGLGSYITTMGYVPHAEAITQQRKSQLLLLIEIDREETKGIIPGKLFEYMVSERPLLAIGPKGADIESIIKSTNTGVFATYQQKALIKQAILQYFEHYKKGELFSHAIGLQQYSRKKLTESLADLIKQCST
ncbi:glycosyltransferase family 4 protein [Flavobacterium rhizosphaerae]|uniref:Glycosyltransferase family 4 protein n=1 Tax=Flavobacterium rhizosphaerae TaxID=3163298 RepID=A0ABW8YTQ0_9FLAO